MMLGREVAKQILDMRPSTHVLYMSGYAETMLGSTGRLAKGMILLDKPFSERTLLAKVQEALATSAPRNGN